MEITYLGHSSFILEVSGKKIIFDPFITPNALASDINVDELKPDYILLSHGHQDHVADVEQIYRNSKATIVSNFEVVSWFQKKGIEQVHPMNHGGKWEFDFGTVKMVNAVHSSSMPDGSYGGNPAGFVIETAEKTFYYAGDTALHLDMNLIGEEFQIDFAFLPIGDNFTMGIADGLKAADFIKTSTIIPMHFDTFPYIEIDKDQAKSLAESKKKELLLLKIGEKINL
ncbi:MAG: metal-dependent hydrolase [Candidatus Cyclobacteriaceae bacterium M3_2C_046]